MTGRESHRHAAGHGPAWTPADHRRADSSVRGDPVSVRHGLMAYVTATRHARRQRSLVIAMILVSAAVMLMAATGWLLTGYVTEGLDRVNAGTAGAPSSGPLNILLAGVDIRAGLTARQEKTLHVGRSIGDNSDTLMVVHIAADRRHVEVISLPRDSWVRIPGHGMNKINAAIGIGGPRLMVRTVEQATGLTINDFAEVNFLGFVKVINTLGGVDICLPFPVDDPYSGLRLAAGRHRVNGITALEFARDRHSFALSDIARIANQHQLIASVITEATKTGAVTNPVRFSRFLTAVTAAVRVDRNFNVIALAEQLRYLPPSAITFVTVPLATMNYLTPTGQSAVLWDRSAAAKLFAEIRQDRTVQPRPQRARRVSRHSHKPAATPSANLSQPGANFNEPTTAASAACR